MDAPSQTIPRLAAVDASVDLETVFHAHYARVARLVARVIRDAGRAEEIAVDVFLKWSRHPAAHGEGAAGWLSRTAVRMALDELRRQARRARYERIASLGRRTPTPEELHVARSDQDRVRAVLARLSRRQAALLLLRHDGLSYDELAATLRLHPASVGTLLARAQQIFRKEYVKRYGHA
jgi:RNA polymerase sigma-70 factor, ECF subfamily